MAPAREIIRTLTIRNRTEGAQETARDLNEVKRAADGVVQSSERTERQTLSNSRAYEQLQRRLDPTYRSFRSLQAAVRTLSSAVEQGNASLSEANGLAAMAAQRYGLAAAEVRDLASAQMLLDRGFNRSLSSANDNLRLTSQQVMGLGYQLNDVATMLLMGASPFQIMASQGGQVVQVLGDGPGGIRGSLQALGAQLGSLATRLAPVGIAVAALGTGVAALRSEINETSAANVSFADVALGMWQMMADGFTSIFRGPIDTVQGWWQTLWENVETFAVSEFNSIARNVAQLGNQIKFSVDLITNHWKGGVETIKDMWALLPVALGDLAIQAANGVIDAVEEMVNGAIDRLNSLVSGANQYLPDWAQQSTIKRQEFGDIGNRWDGSAAEFGGRIRQNTISTIGADLEALRRMQAANAGHADWNAFQDLSGRATANAMRDLADAAKGAGSAISRAANDNVDPWRGLRQETDAATVSVENYSRSIAGGAMQDLRSALDDGKLSWRELGDVAIGVLDDISQRLQDVALDAVFGTRDGRSSGSNFFSGILNGIGSFLGGGVSPLSSSWAPNTTYGGFLGLGYDTGGWTGSGNPRDLAGYVHREEFVVKAGPARRHRAALEAINNNQAVPANGNAAPVVNDNRVYNIDARGAQLGVGAEIRAALNEFSEQELPYRLREIEQRPRQIG